MEWINVIKRTVYNLYDSEFVFRINNIRLTIETCKGRKWLVWPISFFPTRIRLDLVRKNVTKKKLNPNLTRYSFTVLWIPGLSFFTKPNSVCIILSENVGSGQINIYSYNIYLLLSYKSPVRWNYKPCFIEIFFKGEKKIS